MTDLEYRSFAPGLTEDEHADAATAAWTQETAFGFLDAERTQAQLDRGAAKFVENSWTLWGVYEPSASADSWPAAGPVATYATFDRDLNVGGGRNLLAHLVAGVTVRTTHRRRGIMRRLVESDLRTAAAAGIPIAALYAAEATIYGRFGFGPATDTRRVRVDTGPGFLIDHDPTGMVRVVDRDEMAELAPDVFDRYHEQTLGSIRRQTRSGRSMAGVSGNPAEPDLAVRGAVHLDADGVVDGYLTYRHLGWETKPATVSIVEFICLTEDAYLELWQFLGAIDTATLVEWDPAPLSDPLPWALGDRRRYSVSGGEDGVWLRILDVPSALTTRNYHASGEVTFTVTDQLGITDGGYRLAVHGGQVEVDRVDGSTELILDVADLSSLYLGGPAARTLARAGRIRGSQDAVARLDDLLRQDVEPVCSTQF